MKGRSILVGYIIMLGLILQTFNATATPAATAPDFIKIGATVPLTGRLAGSGVEAKIGYEIWADTVNKAGGIFIKEFGKRIPVQLIIYDDETDPVKAGARFEKLYQEKIVAYLGSVSSLPCITQAAVAEKYKVPLVSGIFSTMEPHRRGNRYLFSPFFKAPDVPKRIFSTLNEFFGKEPPNKLAIVMSKTEWGVELGEAHRNYLQKEGYYKVLIDETYPLGATDFSLIISKAKAAGVEVWLSHPMPPEGLAMIRQMKELNYCPKFLEMSIAASSRGWPGGSGGLGEYAIGTNCWNYTLPWPGNKELVEEGTKRLKGELPWAEVGHAYRGGQILGDAIEKAGTLDTEKIRDALAKSEMITVAGPVKVRPDGTFEMILYLSQWQKGRLVAVAPKQATSVAPISPVPCWDKR